MTVLLNLLPWRHAQRQRQRRCRISILVSVIALLMSSFWGGWILLHQQVEVLQKQGSELENQRRKLQEVLQQQTEPLQEVRQYRGSEQQSRVSRWEEILTDLARKLPENSWLRTISWQSSMLTLEGNTSEIDSLEKIETLLKQLPGAFHIKAGPVSYQGDQGLGYIFIMEDTGGGLALP